jgi:hypothetical protein
MRNTKPLKKLRKSSYKSFQYESFVIFHVVVVCAKVLGSKINLKNLKIFYKCVLEYQFCIHIRPGLLIS